MIYLLTLIIAVLLCIATTPVFGVLAMRYSLVDVPGGAQDPYPADSADRRDCHGAGGLRAAVVLAA